MQFIASFACTSSFLLFIAQSVSRKNQTKVTIQRKLTSPSTVASFFAVVMSTVVLGGTVTGMQSVPQPAGDANHRDERYGYHSIRQLSIALGAAMPGLLRRAGR